MQEIIKNKGGKIVKNYEEPVVKIYYHQMDVLTASDENVGASNKNDTDIGWGGNWQ